MIKVTIILLYIGFDLSFAICRIFHITKVNLKSNNNLFEVLRFFLYIVVDISGSKVMGHHELFLSFFFYQPIVLV